MLVVAHRTVKTQTGKAVGAAAMRCIEIADNAMEWGQ
jgi:hypothetical protein